MLLIGSVWFRKGWEQGLRACGASAVLLTIMFLCLLYLMHRENRATNRDRPSVPRRPR
jgi:hypothetical protein